MFVCLSVVRLFFGRVNVAGVDPGGGGRGCVLVAHRKLIYSESDTSAVKSMMFFKTAKVPPSTAPLYANTVFL